MDSENLLAMRWAAHGADQAILCYHPAIINSVNQTV